MRILPVILLLFSFQLSAYEQQNLFQSSRVWGRGGCFVAAHDSDDNPHFNPASLAEHDITYQLKVGQLDFFLGENTIETIQDLSQIGSTKDGVSFLRKFDNKFGEKQHGRLQLSFFAMRFGALSFSPFIISEAFLQLDSPTVPEFQWLSDSFGGMNMSYALKLRKGTLVGITLRPMYRWYTQSKMMFTDILDFLPPSNKQFTDISPIVSGFALGADLGMTVDLSKSLRWGLVVQNVGDTGYFQSSGTQPPTIFQKISTGFLHRNQLGILNLDLFFDIQDLTNRHGLNTLRLLHFGAELGSSLFSRDHDFGLLAGINEGYLTLGGFIDLFFARIEVSNYAKEASILPGQKINRSWAFSIQSSMTF